MDCYNVKELLKFIGESGVGMETVISVAGGEKITRLTYVPDDDILFFDDETDKKYMDLDSKSSDHVTDTIVTDLENGVDIFGYVSVGVGAECVYAVSRERLNKALDILKKKGYSVTSIRRTANLNPSINRQVYIKVLSKKPFSEEDASRLLDQWTRDQFDLTFIKLFHITMCYMMKYHANEFNTTDYANPNLMRVFLDTPGELSFCHRLIKTMERKGASALDIWNVVKYSLVVLDAEKKRLDWRKAAKDFEIEALAEKYLDTHKKSPNLRRKNTSNNEGA